MEVTSVHDERVAYASDNHNKKCTAFDVEKVLKKVQLVGLRKVGGGS